MPPRWPLENILKELPRDHQQEMSKQLNRLWWVLPLVPPGRCLAGCVWVPLGCCMPGFAGLHGCGAQVATPGRAERLHDSR